ncbi:hypothetical protein DSO57_1009528 [Entomophthora muscae]|uniref:Uncharacterized protein n=1 Tax=Entomophthora muscae TaxID=34485 RepID=A0ACC2RLF6_9FUNG|nr:hypothetical protein DSO57_1009528 [Entomophthora muscae]
MAQTDSGGKKKLKGTGGKATALYSATKKSRLGAGPPKEWEDQASESKTKARSEGEGNSAHVNSDHVNTIVKS